MKEKAKAIAFSFTQPFCGIRKYHSGDVTYNFRYLSIQPLFKYVSVINHTFKMMSLCAWDIIFEIEFWIEMQIANEDLYSSECSTDKLIRFQVFQSSE